MHLIRGEIPRFQLLVCVQLPKPPPPSRSLAGCCSQDCAKHRATICSNTRSLGWPRKSTWTRMSIKLLQHHSDWVGDAPRCFLMHLRISKKGLARTLLVHCATIWRIRSSTVTRPAAAAAPPRPRPRLPPPRRPRTDDTSADSLAAASFLSASARRSRRTCEADQLPRHALACGSNYRPFSRVRGLVGGSADSAHAPQRECAAPNALRSARPGGGRRGQAQFGRQRARAKAAGRPVVRHWFSGR